MRCELGGGAPPEGRMMSAFVGKADMTFCGANGCFGPKANIGWNSCIEARPHKVKFSVSSGNRILRSRVCPKNEETTFPRRFPGVREMSDMQRLAHRQIAGF